jgi:hypothetical protein
MYWGRLDSRPFFVREARMKVLPLVSPCPVIRIASHVSEGGFPNNNFSTLPSLLNWTFINAN